MSESEGGHWALFLWMGKQFNDAHKQLCEGSDMGGGRGGWMDGWMKREGRGGVERGRCSMCEKRNNMWRCPL